jgi:hypothetical protein
VNSLREGQGGARRGTEGRFVCCPEMSSEREGRWEGGKEGGREIGVIGGSRHLKFDEAPPERGRR